MVTAFSVKPIFRHFLASALFTTGLGAAEPAINGRPVSAIAESKIETPATSYWAGEVFPLTLSTSVARGFFSSVGPDFEWTPPGIVIEDWSAPERVGGGGPNEIVMRTTRAYVRGTGTVALPGSKQSVRLVTGMAGDRSAITDPFELVTKAPRLTVRPLPTPSPSNYGNAVGEFSLRSSLSTLNAKVGESVTWTLELTGSGNWPEITRLPGRVVSKDFNSVAPVVKRSSKPGTLFDGTLSEDVLLVPTKAGEYQLGPVRYVYFDPKRGKYQMITTDAFTLVVGARSGIAPADTGMERYRPVNAARTPIPASPQALPLDPLGSGWRGLGPLDSGVQTAGVLIAVTSLILFWLWLATERSRRTDPLYSRRQARAKLIAVLDELDRRAHPPEETRRLIFAWQQATIEFAGLTLSTPSAAQIAHAIEGGSRGTVGSSWAPLWRESNAALYGELGLLTLDWVMRARAALSEQTLRPVPFSALFLPRNLLPFAASIVVFVCALSPTPARGDGAALYQKGDFAAAEAEWRQAVAAAPLDAHLHYNLALAAAQQNRWPESMAQSLAAFCVEPGNPAIRWQLALSLDRAGIDNPILTPLVNGTWRHRFARTLSPGQWGAALLLGAVVTSVTMGTLLFGIYRERSRQFRWIAGTCAVVALTFAISSWASIRCYGPLADEAIAVVSRNTLLCSVPTEIDTTQKTVPLPAGSLAKVDRTFLGWSRLVFPNQQTGWARTDAVVRLYR